MHRGCNRCKKRTDGSGWLVYTHGGRKPTELDAVEWAQEVVQRGAGGNFAYKYGLRWHKAGIRPRTYPCSQ